MNNRKHDISKHPTVLLESFSKDEFGRSFSFEGVESVIAAYSTEDVLPALLKVEQAVDSGRHAAGFISYEAASALNPELVAMTASGLPLLWFGIFAERNPGPVEWNDKTNDECRISTPKPDISHERYSAAINSIQEAIAAGETYQVNFTVRQNFTVKGDPFALYRKMCRNQQAPFCAWIDTGSHKILSASPELFFSLHNDRLTMRPMKGTAARMPSPEADRRQKEMLGQSIKDRAENLMIVDLVRNDLSTIALNGTVEVPRLFEIETYPTVHQMTSTVTAKIRPDVGITDIFKALFPCGSITGAPKRRTMEIIRDLEQTPRGVYCGAIGYISPGREAVFSVAIRTAVINSKTGQGEIGIGGGITWDSKADDEFEECKTKSAFMTRDTSDFKLIESLRHDNQGYLMLDRHLKRLAGSAAYFGFRYDNEALLRARLETVGRELSGVHKVRILMDHDGEFSLEAQPIDKATPESPALVTISDCRVDSNDPFLYHKTTNRAMFDRELKAHPECLNVIFLNERGEVTEGSSSNIVVSINGDLLTPALKCGLLPGTLREELLEAGIIREAVMTVEDISKADNIWLINSVRGWRSAELTNNCKKTKRRSKTNAYPD